MARPPKPREPKWPITLSTYDNRWHCYPNVGKKANKDDDIRHISSKDYERVLRLVFALEDEIAAKGKPPEVGRSMKLCEYLPQWHAQGCRKRKKRDGTMRARWKYSTQRDYRLVIDRYIIPNVGEFQLDEFTATNRHAKNLVATVAETVSESAARKTHLVLRSALSDAEEDELVDRNVMKTFSPPEEAQLEAEWLTVEEGRRLIAAIRRRKRMRSRWLMAVMLGERQSQCLGLKWIRPELRGEAGDVNLETGELTIRKALYRKTWEHGCADPVACVKGRTKKDKDGNDVPHSICKSNPCGKKYAHGCPEDAPCGKTQVQHCPQRETLKGCWRHRDKNGDAKDCPPRCEPDCDRHASTCPERVEGEGGLLEDDPKTKAGARTVDMPKPMWMAFRDRKAEQDRERIAAGNLWVETGYIHTTELGMPVDPRRDRDDWLELLEEADIDPIRLHAARHYAVTILILLGVAVPVIMLLLGWSTDMTKRYGHILREMTREAADKIEDFYREPENEPTPPPSQPNSTTDLSTSNVVQLDAWRSKRTG